MAAALQANPGLASGKDRKAVSLSIEGGTYHRLKRYNWA